MQRSQWRHFSILCTVLLVCFSFVSCDVLGDILGGEDGGGLSSQKIAAGLKSALVEGTGYAVGELNKKNGYLGDETVKIPLPVSAPVESQLRRVPGIGDAAVNKVVPAMNQGAEDAAGAAGAIFCAAVTNMTIETAYDILFGEDDAATMYFKEQTFNVLMDLYEEPITEKLQPLGVISVWKTIAETYNDAITYAKNPLSGILGGIFGGMANDLVQELKTCTPLDTNLVRYVTGKALDGLFKKVAIQEKEIRTNVNARVSDLLVEVFGYRDRNK